MRTTLEESKNSTAEYWEESWKSRVKDENSVVVNKAKFDKIIQFLRQFDLKGLKKLDIGCGPCQHAITLGWDNYTGVDLSCKALSFAEKKLPNAKFFLGSVLDIPEEKYDVICAFDALEHIELSDKLAEKIKRLSHDKTIIIGNSPTTNFTIHDETIEHDFTYKILLDFMINCGFPILRTETFYTKGKTFNKSVVWLPFLLFCAERHYVAE